MATVAHDRYRLVERLGQGGTGEVWRAEDGVLGRDVAIKLLHAHVASDPAQRARFRREASAIARLSHPNIIAVLAFDDDADPPYLVEEYCPGGTLTALTRGGPLPWDRVRALLVPIAAALAHAHDAGVIHRDLKPANVLFAQDGRLVVADFGLARLLSDDEATITRSGERMGSPEYWSPEQAAGEPVSERSDVYALGCIAFQLATGRMPWVGDDRLATGYRRVHESPPAPSTINAALPAEADRLVRQLLARRAADRPSAAEVGDLLAGRTITAPTVRLDAGPTARIDRPAPTIVAPAPPRAAPTPPPAVVGRNGVQLGGTVFGLFLGGAGAGVALVADAQSAAVTISRSGIDLASKVGRTDANAAFVILGGGGAVTIALLVLAISSARNSRRGRNAVVRGLHGAASIALASASAATLVWLVHALVTLDLAGLWSRAG